MQIKATVGIDCVNSPDDVMLIQTLINAAGGTLKVDGVMGLRTAVAIKQYQRRFLTKPDGRVDPAGLTMANLTAGKLKIMSLHAQGLSLIVLPRPAATGYYTYSAVDRQYGTRECIAALLAIAETWKCSKPTVSIGLGDISFKDGRPMLPHKSHRHGIHIDVRPLRKDGKQLPISIKDLQYSHEDTKLLVETLRGHANVKAILFNDSKIKGVSHWVGHDNHLHVSMRA